MITEKQIEEAAIKEIGYSKDIFDGDDYEKLDWFSKGATWIQEQKQKEINELVTALKYAKRFVDKERCDVVYIDSILSKYN